MNRGTLTLRSVTEADGGELAELRVVSMRESLEQVGRFDAQRARDRFLSNFKPENTRQICVNQVRAGFVVVRNEDSQISLDHLYIHPSFQGQGLGAATLAVVLQEAEADGKSVRVGALKHSRSNEFYLSHGFRLVEQGEWDNYYVRDPNSAA